MTDTYVPLETTDPLQMPGVRFYCSGSDQGRAEDAAYQRDFERDLQEIEDLATQFQGRVVGQGGWRCAPIGGAGDDSLWVWLLKSTSTIYLILKTPGALAEAAEHAKKLYARMARTKDQEWRVGEEGLVLECCRRIHAMKDDSFTPVPEVIEVQTIRAFEHDLSPLPTASFVIRIPDVSRRETHIFVATTDFEVLQHTTVAGLTETAHVWLDEGAAGVAR